MKKPIFKIISIVLMMISTMTFAQENNYKIAQIPTYKGETWGAIPAANGQIIFVDNASDTSKNNMYSSRLVIMDKENKESATLPILGKYKKIGSPYISEDGKEFYFVVSGTVRSVIGRNIFKSGTINYPLQLMVMKNTENNEWTQPVEFKYNSKKYSTGDPCLSPDGAYLYFTSNKKDGYGGIDIYRSKRNSDGSWGEPENLGNTINTSGKERFPRFDKKGNFYFSSTTDSGNLDLFVCTIDGTNFGTPVKMSLPFNSEGDDFAISFIDEYSGYISSSRDGIDHIYRFDAINKPVVEPVKPVEVAPEPVVEVKPVEVPEPVVETKTVEVVPEPVVETKPVEKPKIDDAVVSNLLETGELEYINFDFDRFIIVDKHIPALKKLITFMQKNPTVIMEVSGYTDCRGKSEYNLKLSHRRATSVRDYLVANGIDAKHIVVKEFGATKPLVDCDKAVTEKAHETNRRVEYKVLN
jgi:outer membrane protein OmpA-like peptidoglycan-associated protein